MFLEQLVDIGKYLLQFGLGKIHQQALGRDDQGRGRAGQRCFQSLIVRRVNSSIADRFIAADNLFHRRGKHINHCREIKAEIRSPHMRHLDSSCGISAREIDDCPLRHGQEQSVYTVKAGFYIS